MKLFNKYMFIFLSDVRCQKLAVIQKGFSLIELLLSMAIFAILIALVTVNFNGIQHKTTLSSTVETLLTDFSQQQIKAMVGDTEGRSVLDNYGVRFTGSSYVLFYATYVSTNSANFTISLPSSQTITTTFPNSQIIFLKGSGEISGYLATQSAVTVRDTITTEQKVIQFNRYGVITAVN